MRILLVRPAVMLSLAETPSVRLPVSEQVVVNEGSVLAVPSSWSMHEAAGFMEATLTAYLNVFQIGKAAKGKSVLIHGGGSGVGT